MSGETDPVCPTCRRTMAQGCLPRACPRWEATAVYDHEAGEWLAIDADGFVLDGRRIEDVR